MFSSFRRKVAPLVPSEPTFNEVWEKYPIGGCITMLRFKAIDTTFPRSDPNFTRGTTIEFPTHEKRDPRIAL